ncbi:hypothetical protein CI109_100124 [Kwoniella shandongensis]|uniref:Uncharacterized protein n=1 Tax=Kwoniella shandongensis TaxID=1734106 RepID=A0A5M6BT88_9TREE|nr:uncharacterized protein CI109_006848 [Kwoniella shandongensis]KAA5524825.1 hypothetical protein CI109_006848 [Kwoniella shandongensis]
MPSAPAFKLNLEDRYLNLPSTTTSAATTPAATEDRPFLFSSSTLVDSPALSRATSRISESSEKEKAVPFSSSKDEEEGSLESGQQTPYDVPPPPLSSYVPEKKTLSKGRRIVLGAVMMSTTFVASATSAASLINIPSSAKDLGITELQAQWIGSAYSLAYACGLLLAGRLADLYGRKYLYLGGMGFFLIFNIISGVIHNYIGICVIRAFTGLAISVALPAAFGIIGVTFDEEPGRTIAFSALALGYPVGGGPGQVIAGLVSGVNPRAWQYVFYILGGLALFPLIVGWYVIPAEPPKVHVTNRRVDWIGAAIITSGLALFCFSITQSGLVENGWKEPYIPAVFAISIVMIVGFGFWEHFAATRTSIPPLVHLGVFRRHEWKVTSVLALSFFAYLPISGWLYLTTIWYQNLKGESPLSNALHILAAPIVGMIACFLVPLLAPRVRAPYLLMFGGFCTAAAQWLFAIEPLGRTYWANEFVSNIMTPFGADFTVGIGSVLISNLVVEDEQSLAGALFQTSLQIASTVGVCLCSLIQTVVSNQTGSLLQGLRITFWIMAGFSWLSMIIAGVTLRKVHLAKDVGKL